MVPPINGIGTTSQQKLVPLVNGATDKILDIATRFGLKEMGDVHG